MNKAREFKLKIKEDEIGPYIIIPPQIVRSLKLKKGQRAVFRVVPKGKKFNCEITLLQQ